LSAIVNLNRGTYYLRMSVQQLATVIGETLGLALRVQPTSRVHGGSISECYRWDGDHGPIFVKVAPVRSRAMFDAEAAGLQTLRLADAVRVPRVLGVGVGEGRAWLALEWIQTGARSQATDSLLGEQLAKQHRTLQSAFGWDRDNTIGSTPQQNAWEKDWVTFLRERRLRYQLNLAKENGHGGRLQQRGEVLLEHLDAFFAAYQPVPSLLHGDLWGGNFTADEQSRPVIFDPAVYYGDREADLAMTRLFGGFGAGFYSAYQTIWALDAGAAVRCDLYNLYHVLNHLNLFGSGYLNQAVCLVDRLLADAGH
jgi:protein-ribulosamine 3-kinase